MSDEMRALCAGVHVLDVLVRPVEAIPEGQGGELVEEIRVTAAGSAGGTALVLAKLGAQVKSAGAIGTDAAGDMLLALLGRDGVDTALLVRRDDVQTSASVLPIRPSGERPAFHVVGANGTFGPTTFRPQRSRRPRTSTSAAPSSWAARQPLRCSRAPASTVWSHRRTCSHPASRACSTGSAPRSRSSTTSCRTTTRCWRSPARTSSRPAAGRCSTAAWAAWPRPAEPTACCSSTRTAHERIPAFEVEAVDTTGCGDAFSAGFLRGLSLGRDRPAAARLGCAAAAMVAQGLGTDHGDYDLAAVEELAG